MRFRVIWDIHCIRAVSVLEQPVVSMPRIGASWFPAGCVRGPRWGVNRQHLQVVVDRSFAEVIPEPFQIFPDLIGRGPATECMDGINALFPLCSDIWRIHRSSYLAAAAPAFRLFGEAGWPFSALPARRRSSSTLAGSSFGSCGTSSPRKALASSAGVSLSTRARAAP